jgi:hypothetical protein
MSPTVTAETLDLTGMWRLVAVSRWTNGVMTKPSGMGGAPAGYLNYTGQGRVIVVLDRRTVAAGGESQLGHERILAYAGGYTRTGDIVRHHLEMCTQLADIGTDYVRVIETDGEALFLCTEPVTKGDKTYVSKAEWVRDSA